MENYISTLTSRLSEVNTVLPAAKTPDDMTIKGVSVLADFLSDFQNTFTLAMSALRGANEDSEKLLKDTTSLTNELYTFQSMDLTLWESFDYEALVAGHLKPFEDEWKRLEAISIGANQILCAAIQDCRSAPRNSERYKELYKEFDEVEEKYFKAKRKTAEAYELLRKEKLRCTGVCYFHFGIFKLLLSKIRVILDSVESDMEDLRKRDLLTSLSKLDKLGEQVTSRDFANNMTSHASHRPAHLGRSSSFIVGHGI